MEHKISYRQPTFPFLLGALVCQKKVVCCLGQHHHHHRDHRNYQLELRGQDGGRALQSWAQSQGQTGPTLAAEPG